jgi:hypothetical protein
MEDGAIEVALCQGQDAVVDDDSDDSSATLTTRRRALERRSKTAKGE